LRGDPKQFLIADSVETTHHSPAKPAVFSTSHPRKVEMMCVSYPLPIN